MTASTFTAPALRCMAVLFASCGSDADEVSLAPTDAVPAATARTGEAAAGFTPAMPFIDVSAASGVTFEHVAGAAGDWALPEIMGGGGALFDMDGDEDLDLLLLAGGSSSTDPTTEPSGGGHGLFRNDGVGVFEDASEGAGFGALRGYAMGAAVADVNGDGALDVYVTQFGQDELLLGDGAGQFSPDSAAWNVDVGGWSSSASFVDYDRDGDLDLFVVRYIELQKGLECRDVSGRRTYCPPASGPALHDVLLRNDGDRFTDISSEVGLDGAPQPGLGVVASDITGNGALDFYVTNDGKPNQLWVRQRSGAWRDEAMQRGVALNGSGVAEASMGIIAEDLDGDRKTDLFMTHLEGETHTLYGARGAGHFTDRTGRAGLNMVTRAGTGFGVAAFDLELDGDLDLAIAQGRVRVGAPYDGCTMTGAWPQLAEPNLILTNGGKGDFQALSCASVTAPITLDRAALSGDLDSDGDIDLIFTRVEGKPQILRNEAVRRGGWVLVDPRVSQEAATALGAIVTVNYGDVTMQRTSRASDGYQSSRDPRIHFGLPGEPESVEVVVVWPDGSADGFVGVAPGAIWEVIKGTGEAR